MEYTHIADQLLAAGTALAGLILIFISNAVTAYDGFRADERRVVRIKYKIRTLMSFCAFAFSSISAVGSLLYFWIRWDFMIVISAAFFVAAFVTSLAMAYLSIGDIK